MPRQLFRVIALVGGLAAIDIGQVIAASGANSPVIYSISPLGGAVGTTITLSGANFTAENNTVKFGGGYIQWLSAVSAAGGNQAIVFTVAAVISNSPCPGTTRCPTAAYPVSPGANKLSVQNANGTSNEVSFDVTN